MNCDATKRPGTIVLCLGNELLADDAIGIRASEVLGKRLGRDVTVVASSQSGLALLELLEGYDRAIIVDAIKTGRCPVGQINRLSPRDLRNTYAPSPHYAGLPEMFAIAECLALRFPSQVDLVAIEVGDVQTVGGDVSEDVAASLDNLIGEVEAILENTDCGNVRHA
jgi:hydrogenase maturation protease